jgi:thiol-disulfide isomerase/thioredoxin
MTIGSPQAPDKVSRSFRRWLRLIFLLPLLAVAGFAIAQNPPGGFIVHDAPKPLAAIDFKDGDGHPRKLADFGGIVVLLNIWATWCTPCRHEMPTLDRLQAEFGGEGFEVVALSIDRTGAGVVDKFYREIGITRLAKYIDVSGKAARDLGVPGLPTTLLVDRAGREVGRLFGPAEWDSPEMKAFIQMQIAKETNR